MRLLLSLYAVTFSAPIYQAIPNVGEDRGNIWVFYAGRERDAITGTGVYPDGMRGDFQKQILERMYNNQYEPGRYLYAFRYDSTVLYHVQEYPMGRNRLWSTDIIGREIIGELLHVGRKPVGRGVMSRDNCFHSIEPSSVDMLQLLTDLKGKNKAYDNSIKTIQPVIVDDLFVSDDNQIELKKQKKEIFKDKNKIPNKIHRDEFNDLFPIGSRIDLFEIFSTFDEANKKWVRKIARSINKLAKNDGKCDLTIEIKTRQQQEKLYNALRDLNPNINTSWNLETRNYDKNNNLIGPILTHTALTKLWKLNNAPFKAKLNRPSPRHFSNMTQASTRSLKTYFHKRQVDLNPLKILIDNFLHNTPIEYIFTDKKIWVEGNVSEQKQKKIYHAAKILQSILFRKKNNPLFPYDRNPDKFLENIKLLHDKIVELSGKNNFIIEGMTREIDGKSTLKLFKYISKPTKIEFLIDFIENKLDYNQNPKTINIFINARDFAPESFENTAMGWLIELLILCSRKYDEAYFNYDVLRFSGYDADIKVNDTLSFPIQWDQISTGFTGEEEKKFIKKLAKIVEFQQADCDQEIFTIMNKIHPHLPEMFYVRKGKSKNPANWWVHYKDYNYIARSQNKYGHIGCFLEDSRKAAKYLLSVCNYTKTKGYFTGFFTEYFKEYFKTHPPSSGFPIIPEMGVAYVVGSNRAEYVGGVEQISVHHFLVFGPLKEPPQIKGRLNFEPPPWYRDQNKPHLYFYYAQVGTRIEERQIGRFYMNAFTGQLHSYTNLVYNDGTYKNAKEFTEAYGKKHKQILFKKGDKDLLQTHVTRICGFKPLPIQPITGKKSEVPIDPILR